MSITTCSVCYIRNREYVCRSCHDHIYELLEKPFIKLYPQTIPTPVQIKSMTFNHNMYFCRKINRKDHMDSIMILDESYYNDIRNGVVSLGKDTGMTFPRKINNKYWELYDKYNRVVRDRRED